MLICANLLPVSLAPLPVAWITKAGVPVLPLALETDRVRALRKLLVLVLS